MATAQVTSEQKASLPAIAVRRDGAPAAENPLVESFRLLALNALRLLADRPRSILVMSALPGDGRSFTAARLAQALCEISAPVMLVDADPLGAADGTHRAWDPRRLRFVALGKAHFATQAELLAQTNETLAVAERDGIPVVVDTPACTRSSIAFHLAPRVGGVLYLARRRPHDASVHGDVRAQLDLLGANVLGVVFNEA
jgi:Mrp family chromosome partitioning ATPase